MAMGITLAENRVDLGGDRLFVEDRGVHAGPDRLGAADRHQGRHRAPWRAYVRDCPAVSRPRT